jgi:regulator of protease activity HflC (stomatin/prohibitin superfamily)
MDNAFAWLRDCAEWLGRFIPKWVILDTTEGAIKYKGGRTPVVCGAGIHFYWPIRSTFVVYPTARQTDRLETQTMETTDGKTFIVSGTLTYHVEDLGLLVPRTHSPLTTVVDISMTAIHDVCCDMDWENLQREQRRGTLKTKLRKEAQQQLTEYGIHVIKLQLNTLARARVFKVSQSTATEEN